MKHLNKLCYLFLFIFVLESGHYALAQDSVSCSRADFVSLLAFVVNDDEVDNFFEDYVDNNNCDDATIAAFQQIIDAYKSVPISGDSDCQYGTVSCIASFDFDINLAQDFEFGTGTSEYTDDCKFLGDAGLEIGYDGSGDFYGFGIHFVNMDNSSVDISQNTYLTFYVLGLSDEANNEFRIGLKDSGDQEFKVESRNWVVISTSHWRRVQIPLALFAGGGVNLAMIENVSFDFNATDHSDSHICLDALRFNS